MPSTSRPSLDQIFARMQEAMGELPSAVEKLARVDPELIYEHLRSQAYAMPTQSPALDDETRILIYLAAALASSSHACIRATADKARMQGISREKLLETVRIARLAMATRVISDAEPVFDILEKRV